MREVLSVEQYQAKIGTELGVSDWVTITQQKINLFADVTHDWQFIHVDPVRAKAETPFGGSIAHGFLTLSMLSSFSYAVLPDLENTVAGINYGFDKVRFISPVNAGSRIRGRIVLKEFAFRKPKEIATRVEVTVEIEGNTKPALVAEWLGMRIIG